MTENKTDDEYKICETCGKDIEGKPLVWNTMYFCDYKCFQKHGKVQLEFEPEPQKPEKK